MIYLTSSVASVADHLYKEFLSDKGYKSVLFIDTAAEPEIGDGDDDWFYADIESLERQGYQVDRYTITGKNREEIKEKLDVYDIIYMSGGNTTYLLSQIQQSNSLGLFVEEIKKGRPYIGTSAGSIIVGPRIPDYFLNEGHELQDIKGFNIVNFTLVPHWGSKYFKDIYLGERLKIVYRDTQDPLLLLTDFQYVVVDEKNASFKIIDTKN